jgi:cellulose biosynthesis protein BcsQ
MNVSVVSRKGGVGKTVTALHLAGYLAGLGGEQRVVLVDTDPSRNALRASERGGGFPFGSSERRTPRGWWGSSLRSTWWWT